MKKQLLVGTALFAAVSAFSQSGYMKPKPTGIVNMAQKLASKYAAADNPNEPAGTAAKASPVSVPNTEVTNVEISEGVSAVLTPTVQWKAIGGTMNIYGMLVSESKPLQYSDELNAVSMIHRKGTTYNAQPTSNSGAIVAHISQDWGATWDSTCIWSDGTNLARYPQGGIYNLGTNTNINNAYVVGMGPVTAGTGWVGNWYASKQLGSANYNNTASSTPGAQQFIANTPPFGPNTAKHDFSRYAFQATDDGAVRSMAGRFYGYDGPTGQPTDFRGAAIVKGIFSAGVFNWVTDTLLPNAVTRTDGTKQLYSFPLQAWNEAGTTGYVIIIGALATASNANLGWQPIVYKTTNSGGSWSQVNGIDFNAPSFSPILDHIPSLNSNTAVTAPFFGVGEGFDMVVDANDKLHIFSTLQGEYSQHQDSLEYSFSFGTEKYNWLHVPGLRPYLYEFIGDGTSSWNWNLVDSLSSEGPSSDPNGGGYADNPWDADPNNNNAKVTSDSRIQCGRTPDGQFIVVTWAESDTNFTAGAKKWNTIPNLHARCAMTGTSTTWSPTEPVFTKPSTPVPPTYTVNNNVANRAMFHYQSRSVLGVACPNNTVQIKVPVTISNSSPYSQLVENRLWYSTATLEFTGLSCGNVGLVNQSLAYNVNSIDVYPNPAHSNATVVLNLKEEAAVTVYVYNMVGQVVKSASVAGVNGENKIDLTLDNMPAGMYMVKVKAGNTTSVKKIIVN